MTRSHSSSRDQRACIVGYLALTQPPLYLRKMNSPSRRIGLSSPSEAVSSWTNVRAHCPIAGLAAVVCVLKMEDKYSTLLGIGGAHEQCWAFADELSL